MYSSCALRAESHFNIGRHYSKSQQKKRLFPDVDREKEEKVKSDYDRYSLRLKEVGTDAVCEEKVHPILTVKVATIIE